MHTFRCDKDEIVKTDKGNIQGYYYDGIYSFKGIPYAIAGRFEEPRPLEPWEDVKDCTSYGYVCPLLKQDRLGGELMVTHRFWLMDEDCLNLNIWTPGPDEKKRPVMVWLHGGAYSFGSAIEHVAYEGENLSRDEDVVVVSVNHRLNILGYLDLSPYGEKYANTANLGMDDIIAALRWIQENISRFGGDPENVTLFGHSGGGGKIITLLQMPAADRLFHKGIIMSGVLDDSVYGKGEGDSTYLVEAMLKELGEPEGNVSALEKVSYDRLAKAYNKVSPKLLKEGKYVGCAPKKNAYFLGDPGKVGFRKETSPIPLITGTVFGEFPFIPLGARKDELSDEDGRELVKQRWGEEAAGHLLPLFEEAYPWRNPADILTADATFRYKAMKFIRERAKMGSEIYSYLFDLDFSLEGGKSPWHGSDIPFFFRNTEYIPVTGFSAITPWLEKQMSMSITSFARTGKPYCDEIACWPQYKEGDEATVLFGKEIRICHNHDARLMEPLAKKVIPMVRQIIAGFDAANASSD